MNGKVLTQSVSVHAAYNQHSFTLRLTDTLAVTVPCQVPVLCYHQIRNWDNQESPTKRQYIVPVPVFKDHMEMLHNNGYHVITPDQLVSYLLCGTTLPDRPVMLSFDDGSISQFDNALPVLDKYGFKATFFIMTVTLDKPGYLSKEQVRTLAEQGHTIGCHTWDHHKITGYTEKDWSRQLTEPTRSLEQIAGKPVRFFSYPYGVWNATAIERLKRQGYVAAFQLGSRENTAAPLFTIRRLIADGRWNGPQLAVVMKMSFH